VAAEFDFGDGRHVVLRSMKRGDLDRLVAFANKVVKDKKANRELGIVGFDSRITRRKEGEFLKGTLDGMKTNDVLSLAAFVDGELVGHCDIRRRKPRDFHHSGVLGVVILEGFRNLGLGRRMMTKILEEARRAGVWLVELTVFATNGPAIHLYGSMGFRRVGVVPGKFLRDGRLYDEVVMFADLRGSDKSPSTGRRES
jgi:ribosomal protein S18 acetylase RimI-like enzyme